MQKGLFTHVCRKGLDDRCTMLEAVDESEAGEIGIVRAMNDHANHLTVKQRIDDGLRYLPASSATMRSGAEAPETTEL